MVFNATFNNISVISWRSVLLVEEAGLRGENHRPVASHWQNFIENTLRCLWLVKVSLTIIIIKRFYKHLILIRLYSTYRCLQRRPRLKNNPSMFTKAQAGSFQSLNWLCVIDITNLSDFDIYKILVRWFYTSG